MFEMNKVISLKIELKCNRELELFANI